MSPVYIPSQLLPGETEHIRQRSFTRWMSRDLLQAACDFGKNLGLASIYSECSSDLLIRYLFWSPPPGALVEIRSGRDRAQFEEFDRAKIEGGWPLLSLHINENGFYSAVWISPQHSEAGEAMLGFYGITPARRPSAE